MLLLVQGYWKQVATELLDRIKRKSRYFDIVPLVTFLIESPRKTKRAELGDERQNAMIFTHHPDNTLNTNLTPA